jgi:crotonobetainyl-CoA:carnitine CoA-transferase CaiB-like acyl-CoA transferase
MAATLMEEHALGLDREGSGNRAQSAGPADVYAARDGHVLLQVVGPGMFRRCARLLGREDWLSDERFGDDDARGRHGAELSAVVAGWCAPRSVQECLTAFAAAGLPAAPVLSPRQVLEHTGIAAGGFWLPGAGLPLTRIPVGLSDCGSADPPLAPAPALGADTMAILNALGLDPAALAALRSSGALGIPGGK